MSLSNVTKVTTATEVATSTSLSTTVSGGFTAGKLVIVVYAADNIRTSASGLYTGSSDGKTVSDSQGNTYTFMGEYTNIGTGAARTAATVGAYYSILTTGLTSGVDTITLATATTCVQAFQVFRIDTTGTSIANNATPVGVAASASVGIGGSLSITTTGSNDKLLVRACAREGNATASCNIGTPTTGWTDIGTPLLSDTGTSGSSMMLAIEYILDSSAGSKTSNPTAGNGTTGDLASILWAFEEITSGGSTFNPVGMMGMF
jgi:hypothetical protein